MNFGKALEALKEGKEVARSGWNGKGMWLKLVDGKQYWITPFPHRLNDTPIGLLPWLGMRTADNMFVPWLASQTDILAEDWVIL